MDYFLLLSHTLVRTTPTTKLSSLKAILLNEQGIPFEDSSESYENLQHQDHFKECIKKILTKINNLTNNFTNVQLLADEIQLFQRVLPLEFSCRKLSFPYVFTNFVDWKQICYKEYGCISKQFLDLAKQMNIIEQNDINKIVLQIIQKLRLEGFLPDTDAKIIARVEEASFQKNQNQKNFCFFKVIGLPFQISKNEIVQKIIEADKYSKKKYDFSLIFEHGRFSGRAVLKIESEYEKDIWKKDRMYIGKRYIQIEKINEEEYLRHKLNEEKERESKSHQLKKEEIKNKEKHKRSQEDSESGSHQSRSRSRDQRKKHNEIASLLTECGVKIRGLPFSYNSWQVQDIFNPFRFTRGSIKMGFKGDLKSGQAMLLFPNSEQAQKCLSMQGMYVENRYLELKVVSKQEYQRFK